MLDTKYYKDLNHNYLIIKENIEEKEVSYQHSMITANRMKHLLACKIRYVNGESHFYYEISSRQSLNSLFANKEIDYKQLHRLFEHMREALSELDNYMLDNRRLILQPEYIFAEPETENFYFLYYPHYEEEEITTQVSLAQFLVDKVNHQQEEAVMVVYKIYEMMQDNQFILSEILSMFEDEEDTETALYTPGYTGASSLDERPEGILPAQETDRDYEEICAGNKETERPKHLLAAGILMCICIIASAGILCLRNFYFLSAEEDIFSIAGIGILTAMSAFLMLYLLLNAGVHHGKEWKKEEMIPPFTSPALNNNMPAQPIPKTIYSFPNPEPKQKSAADLKKDEDAEYGNTVFLEASMNRSENKLYGTNKGNKYHIDLNQLPCTIGKMAGSVDVVIKDSTISRIHARFTRQEEGICVTDLNSTNGSFKNGLRMEPNETVLIEPGDELRFGRMTFCYR